MQIIIPTQKELDELGITRKPLGIVSPESAVAHKYLDDLKGVEIGAASYQPFGLDSLNLATPDEDDRSLYKKIQIHVCGCYYTVDIEAEADRIPLEDHSQDYVIASHVLEHTSDPIATLLEWHRIVKQGGYIYLIVPKRDNSPYGDANRRISPLSDFRVAFEQSWTPKQAYDFMYDRPTKDFDRMRGHAWVFDLDSLLELVRWCNKHFSISWEYFDPIYALGWKLIEAHETDDKDGMGHMVVFQQC